jgi:demethylmenaquinone methyltransferase/2-methoxy-6-polyprenyl-1,4-benzoquinol methylase
MPRYFRGRSEGKSAVTRRPAASPAFDPTAAAFVRTLFNDTAPYYDTINAIFSLGSGGWYRRRCLKRAGLKPRQTVLDVAIGTGMVASAARDIVGAEGLVMGLDLSEAMLAETRRKLDLPLVQGTAMALPFAEGSIDFLVMGYAVRHIADLEACFREFHRVLKPGGMVLVLEVSQPVNRIYRTTLGRYLGRAVPRLSHWITGQPKVHKLMRYHWQTMETSVAPEVIAGALENSGFTKPVCEAWFDLFRSYAGRKPVLS